MPRLGGNPLAEKYRKQGEMTLFKDVALSVHALHDPALKNQKYAEQWVPSLENYVFPILGDRAISSITSAVILAVLTPIWSTKHDTAKKIRQRLSIIMKWAKAHDYVPDENPVELANPILSKQQKKETPFHLMRIWHKTPAYRSPQSYRSCTLYIKTAEIYPTYEIPFLRSPNFLA